MEALLTSLLSAVATAGLIVAGFVWREKRNGRPPNLSAEMVRVIVREAAQDIVAAALVNHVMDCPNVNRIEQRLERMERTIGRILERMA